MPRARADRGRIAAVTGSVGKTGDQGDAARTCCRAAGEAHCVGSVVQQSLGRAADAGAHAARTPTSAIFEIGMNHAGEIAPLVEDGPAACRDHHHDRAGRISAFFDSVEDIADAKAEIFVGLEPGGAAILNRDNPQFDASGAAARGSRRRAVVTFGEHAKARRRGSTRLRAAAATAPRVCAEIGGQDVAYKLGAPGRHIVAERARGARRGRARRRRPRRGARWRWRRLRRRRAAASAHRLAHAGRRGDADRRELQRQSGLDARGDRASRQRRRASGGRRIAVLGDMRELGEHSAALHAGLAACRCEPRGVDIVLLAGPLKCSALADALPAALRGRVSRRPPTELAADAARRGAARATWSWSRRRMASAVSSWSTALMHAVSGARRRRRSAT